MIMTTKEKTLLEFRINLLTEDKSYLGRRIGDILNGLHELEQNSSNIGTRELTNNAEGIVNQIRRILHTNWPRDDRKHLESLQKIGVSIMRAIEEKGDLPSTISDSGSELEKVLGDLGVKVNNLGSPEESEGAPPDEPSGTAKGQGKEEEEKKKEKDGQSTPPVPPEIPATGMPTAQAGQLGATGKPTQPPPNPPAGM